jgi:hypothetical protein
MGVANIMRDLRDSFTMYVLQSCNVCTIELLPYDSISLFGIPVAHAPIRRISLPGYRSGGIDAVYALSVTEHFLSRNACIHWYWVFLSSFIK